MSTHLERISLKKDSTIPLVVVKEHLIRYVYVLNLVYDKDVLDIACGTGYGMYLMSYWAKTVSGYDISKEAIEEAKKFNYKCPVCLETRNLQENKILSNHKAKVFDVITSFETIEHLENPEILIKNAKLSLKKDGYFIFSVPNKLDLKDKNPWHKSVFNIVTISKLMNKYYNQKAITWLGQNQLGFSNNLSQPYLLGKIQA